MKFQADTHGLGRRGSVPSDPTMGDKSGMGDNTNASVFELEIDPVDFSSTRIYHAIKGRAPSQVLRAIYSGEDVTLRDREFHSTYLHLVVSVADPITEEKLVPVIYQLSNAGVDVHAKDYKGRTALELALSRELQDLMVALLRVGIDPTQTDYARIIRNLGSPFELELHDTLAKYAPGMWSAVADNNTGMIHMLVNSWCRVNTTRDGMSLIDFAKDTKKSPELTSVLEDFMVTIEFVHATMAGDERRMLEFLMDSQPCDPYIMDISHQERWSAPLVPRSLRDTAKAMGHMHVLHLLPESEDSDQDDKTKQAEGGDSDNDEDEEEEQATDTDDDGDDVVFSNQSEFRNTFTYTECSDRDLKLNLSLLEQSMDRQSATGGSDRGSSKNSSRGASRSTSISKSEAGYLEHWYNFNEGRGSRHTQASYVTPGLAEDYSKNWWREKEKAERKQTQAKAKYRVPFGKKNRDSRRVNKESKMCVVS